MRVRSIAWFILIGQWLLPVMGRADAVWVEDFKQHHLGMDHPWEWPVVILGDGAAAFVSDGENARLSLRGKTSFRASVSTARDFECEAAAPPRLQVRFSRLSPEARLKIYGLADADGRVPHLLVNHKNTSSTPSAALLTVDLSEKLPAGTRRLGLRLELDRDNRERVPGEVEVVVDWIKIVAGGAAAAAPGAPRPVAPAQQSAASNPPTLTWEAPEGFTGERYTVSLSRDPYFSAACTTVLDGVPGRSYQPAAPLAPGRWYWTVAATDASGLSGEFMQDPATSEPLSFTVEGDGDESAEFPYFNLRAGSQAFGSIKKFTDEPKLVEQARRMLEMGSDAIKFLLGADADHANYVSVYKDLSDEIRHRSHTLVELIENEPAYKTVFDMPFKYFVMWVNPMDMTLRLGEGEYNEPEMEQEYQQLYDLTRYFMQTYQGTGKVFLIGHWEGDNMLMEDNDLIKGTPREAKLEDMRKWLANRQKAVEDGRNSLPDVTGVEVYNYAELNIITPVLDDGLPRLINAVLPHVAVDLVSYSAYNCMNHTDELPERAWRHFDYILEHAKFTGAWKHGKPVFMGEYGIPMPLVPSRPARNLIALKSAASWGSPINLYWSVYTQLENGNSALIELDGTKNQEYHDMRDFLDRMHLLKHATRVWLGRNPTELEANYLALEFDQVKRSELLARIVNSHEYRALVSDEEFLDWALAACGIRDEAAAALRGRLEEASAEGQAPRFDLFLTILDSPEFAQAVSDRDFRNYLAAWLSNGSGQYAGRENVRRSELYLDAIDCEEFSRRDHEFAQLNQVTEAIRAKYQPNFAASGRH